MKLILSVGLLSHAVVDRCHVPNRADSQFISHFNLIFGYFDHLKDSVVLNFYSHEVSNLLKNLQIISFPFCLVLLVTLKIIQHVCDSSLVACDSAIYFLILILVAQSSETIQ